MIALLAQLQAGADQTSFRLGRSEILLLALGAILTLAVISFFIYVFMRGDKGDS